ncbi:MAG: hypothetical protein U9R74_08315 [Pseudomonadota bacterium]|nr:hypothetical protein [Pseudomonadota bacterium]
MGDRTGTTRLFVKSGNAMRLFLINTVIFILVGIWLTDFAQVHWFLYAIPVIFTLSAAFGMCPGLNLWKMILGER